MTYLLNHQRTIFGTEADTVAKGDSYVCFTSFVGDVIEITIRVRFIEINRGWDFIRVHRAEGGS